MLKKIIVLVLAVMTALTALMPMGLGETNGPVTMYVYTQDGGSLNVRSTPGTTGSNILGTLRFGAAVMMTGIYYSDPQWAIISYGSGTAYVMARFLTNAEPGPSAQTQAEINRQMATYRAVSNSFIIIARPADVNGWVNFRTNPSVNAERITTLRNGRTLTVVGETVDWYQAVDSITGRIGYVSKDYVARLG